MVAKRSGHLCARFVWIQFAFLDDSSKQKILDSMKEAYSCASPQMWSAHCARPDIVWAQYLEPPARGDSGAGIFLKPFPLNDDQIKNRIFRKHRVENSDRESHQEELVSAFVVYANWMRDILV